MTYYYQNLNLAYRSIEKKFNQFKSDYDGNLPDYICPVLVSDEWLPTLDDHPRALINLDNEYVVKIIPIRGRGLDYIYLEPLMSKIQATQEEINFKTFQKYGVNEKNGFIIPNHKVVGLEVDNGSLKINEDGIGLTICDDLSESGAYLVTDIKPDFFYSLENRDEFLAEYKRNIDALLELYHNPNINCSINRHGSPSNPLEPISRMLLCKEKDNIGQVVIGDLDNLLFEEK